MPRYQSLVGPTLVGLSLDAVINRARLMFLVRRQPPRRAEPDHGLSKGTVSDHIQGCWTPACSMRSRSNRGSATPGCISTATPASG
jgi:hypothetical protein